LTFTVSTTKQPALIIFTSNISTERLKWCVMLWQMWGSMFCQTLNVRVAKDTQNIQSSDWPKCIMMLCYFLPFVWQKVISDGLTMDSSATANHDHLKQYNFKVNGLGLNCLVTIWSSKYKRKRQWYFLFVKNLITQTKAKVGGD